MWNWFNCYLSGRHEYGPWCEPGAMFLRCVHCGKRSGGWTIGPDAHRHQQQAVGRPSPKTPATPTVMAQPADARVLPFGRVAAR